nr:cell wall hydrolase [uncultured Clostridium sp.]
MKLNFKSTILALSLVLASSSSVYAATYQVKSGDTLGEISTAYNTTTNILMKNNRLLSSTIQTGQVLDVPTNTYKVVSGDSLYFIAKKYNLPLDKIRIANNKWSDTIYPGDVFKIPNNSGNDNKTSQNKAENKQSITQNSSLTQSLPQDNNKVIKYSNSDVKLLAKLITAEASGESNNAMVSVGAVVVNRVQSSKYPNNISSVINQQSGGHYQFTPVMNGMINKTASNSALNAAYKALNGSDPTNGALFFYDGTVTNKWLTSKPVAITLGKLIFAY